MRELIFDVAGQMLKKNGRCDFKNIVRGTDKYLTIKLLCSTEWKKVNKVLTIKNTDNEEFYIPYYNSPIYLTKEMTKGSLFLINVIGKTEKVMMQTNTVIVEQE